MAAFLTTPRLTLRRLEESDLPGWAAAFNSLRVVENTAAAPWPFTLNHARAYMRRAHLAGPGCLRAIAALKAQPQKLIGGAIIEPIEEGMVAEIGYWIAEGHWAKGYGGEIAQALADHAIRGFGYERLIASYCHGNEGSRRILTRMGFRHVRHSQERTPGLGAKIMVGHLELTRREWLQGMGRALPCSRR